MFFECWEDFVILLCAGSACTFHAYFALCGHCMHSVTLSLPQFWYKGENVIKRLHVAVPNYQEAVHDSFCPQGHMHYDPYKADTMHP